MSIMENQSTRESNRFDSFKAERQSPVMVSVIQPRRELFQDPYTSKYFISKTDQQSKKSLDMNKQDTIYFEEEVVT